MKILLSALGWVDEDLQGVRLRWSYDFDSFNQNEFIGLPQKVLVQRAILDNPGKPLPYDFYDHASWPIPHFWWEDMPDISTPTGLPSRWVLPRTVQAVFFRYTGPTDGALLQVYGRTLGVNGARKPVIERTLASYNLIEASEISEIVFFSGSVTLTQVRILDLFNDHDADLDYQTIATLAPRVSASYDLQTAYQRYPSTPDIPEEEWDVFQNDLIQEAITNQPQQLITGPDDPSAWQQVATVLSLRWEYAMLYGLAFLDGPNATAGTADDSVNTSMLLQTMPDRTMVYRVTCLFDNDNKIISNPIPVRPRLISPLRPPTNLNYKKPTVRLFGEDIYQLKTTMHIESFEPRAIGVEIEEFVSASAILGSKNQTDEFIFRSWRASDNYRKMALKREREVPFYDTALNFRARCLDGWDRVSSWSDWTVPKTPAFIHSPEAPPLISAAHIDQEVILIADNDNNSFAAWEPDHAVRHTPASSLEIFRQVQKPAGEEHFVQLPNPHDFNPEVFTKYSLRIPASISDPARFIGGKLIAGGSTHTILEIIENSFIIAPTADSTGNAGLFMAGRGVFHQGANHPDLFQKIAEVALDDLDQLLKIADPLSVPAERTEHEYYAIRVKMLYSIGPLPILGRIGNVVSAARHPLPLNTPPPFTIEFLGVDFYNRTLVRTQFTEVVNSGIYSMYWADGVVVDSNEFAEIANKGEHGAQTPYNALHLFENFSMPIPKHSGKIITIGIHRENEGGFKSEFVIVQIELPVYTA